MKVYAVASAPPSKRRWKGLALAVVALVFFSLLVPLVFLLGLHNRFPYGYLTDDSSAPDSSFERFDKPASQDNDRNPVEDDHTKIVDNLVRRFGPSISKDVGNMPMGTDGDFVKERHSGSVSNENLNFSSEPKGFSSEGVTSSIEAKQEPPPSANETKSSPGQRFKSTSLAQRGVETENSCQLEFGSYCLWSLEHKEEMKDSMVKKLKDQLFVARAYYPSIAKLQSQEKLSRELKQNIQDHERMLSEALVDADLPLDVEKKMHSMEETIARAKSFHVDCNNVDKKLRQILDLTEDEAHFHMRQSAFLYHLGVQTMPKNLHCLSMRLTVEYFKSPSSDTEHEHSERLVNPDLHHYVIFSKNILASSVAINSTVMNTKESGSLVFHLLTDNQNYFSMKFWFSRIFYMNAVIHVQNIEDYALENSKLGIQLQLSLSEEFRISIRSVDQPSAVHTRTEYISVFGHAYFLLPDIFRKLRRIIVLDDDVVVQHDLSPLWDLDLKGKVNGAVEYCGVQLGHLKGYLGEKSYDKDMCVWMSGLSVVDLDRWRDLNVTRMYRQFLYEHMKRRKRTETTWRTAALPTAILAFRNLVYVLNDSWVLSGLGTDYGVDEDAIKNAAVLHYNGNMKPWLELGIPKYKMYWRDFLTRQNQFMDECNVNP